MTEAEKSLYRSDDYERQMFAAPVRSKIGPDGKTLIYSGRVEQGIKITVKSKAQSNEEMLQSAAAENVIAEEAAGSNANKDVTMIEEEKKAE